MNPQIIAPPIGVHNADLAASANRIERSSVWKDLSTVIIIPAGGTIPTKVVSSWLNLYSPPNNRLYRMFAVGLEVGEAYTKTIETILATPELSSFKYILTLEHDNIPQPDALVRLQARMEEHPEFDCIGGLYWTKGEGGVPQIWGDPHSTEINFRPQIPQPGQLVECCGTGMGFNLWRTSLFRDERLRRPWFKTQVEGGCATQDLYFWSDARKHGHRCAIDCDILVGHYDYEGKFGPEDMVW